MTQKFKCLLFSAATAGAGTRSLGVNRIAHVLRDLGWDAEVIEWAGKWQLEQLKNLAKLRITSDTKFIGLSVLFTGDWSQNLEEFVLWIKQEYPHLQIISGGQGKKVFCTLADYHIYGFGEIALVELLKYLFSNGSRPRFELLPGSSRKTIDAISSYPAYPLDSYMVKYEDRDFIVPGETLTIEFARGCKFSCDFCNFPVLGVKGDYSRSSDDFREQVVDAYDRFGVTSYNVADETFNDRTEKITKFADVVQTLPFTLWFNGFIRADLLVNRPRDREELLRLNMINQFYGIESFNSTAAKAVGKGMNRDKLKNGLIDIRKYYETHGHKQYRGTLSFIVGLPGETEEDILETRQWSRTHWRDQWLEIYPLWMVREEYTKPSKISVNYRDYGYTEIEDVDTPKDVLQGPAVNWGVSMNWKSSIMTYPQARNIAYEWLQEVHLSKLFLPGGFSIFWSLLSDLSIPERLKLTVEEFYQHEVSSHSFYTNYIEKKLNL